MLPRQVVLSVSGLLIADTAKTGEILGQAVLDVPPLMCSAVFCGGLAGLCYFLEPDQLDKANGGLLAAVLLSFVVRFICIGR